MKVLVGFVPVAIKFFGEEGMSSSQANAVKNNNTNTVEGITQNLDQPVNNTLITVISATGTVEKEIPVTQVTETDFLMLKEVENLNGESSILGHGINLSKKIEKIILSMPIDEIIQRFSIPVVDNRVPAPQRKAIVPTNIEAFMNNDNVEELLSQLPLFLLEKLDDKFVFGALKNEARAAVLGKQLTKKESFLKRVLKAPKELLVSENETNFGLVIKKLVLAYTPEQILEFAKIQEVLYKEYTSVQSQVNGVKKVIKDLVREADLNEARVYQEQIVEYQKREAEYRESMQRAHNEANVLRQQALTELAQAKIRVQ